MKPTRKKPFQKLKLISLACLTALAGLIWFALVPALALEANRPAAWSTRGASRPNIIFIMADDLGNADLGYRGSDIKTPNIDKLAREGVRLESFHGMPVCTPPRAALMTGRYPMRYGLQTLVIFPNHTYGLPTDERTLPQALRDAGYQTSMVGKWHLGHADKKNWPQNRGFDHFYGNLVGEVDYFTKLRGGIVDNNGSRAIFQDGWLAQLQQSFDQQAVANKVYPLGVGIWLRLHPEDRIKSPYRSWQFDATTLASAQPLSPALVVLSLDGQEVARTTAARTVPAAFSASETFDVGVDFGSTVSLDYFERRPFPFDGTIHKVEVRLNSIRN